MRSPKWMCHRLLGSKHGAALPFEKDVLISLDKGGGVGTGRLAGGTYPLTNRRSVSFWQYLAEMYLNFPGGTLSPPLPPSLNRPLCLCLLERYGTADEAHAQVPMSTSEFGLR